MNKIQKINPHIRIDFCDKAVFNKLEFWDIPEQPQLYCGNVECTALLPDMRMGRCGAGAYTRFAPQGMIPQPFLASKDMIYDLKQFNRDSFWFWRKRYPLDACSYCNFSQKLRSGPWKVEPGRKPFNESLEQQYHIHVASMMLYKGDVLESENRLRYIENNYDMNKEFSNLAGLVKFQKGDYHDANIFFRQALSQDPEYLPALRNLKVLLKTKKTSLESA